MDKTREEFEKWHRSEFGHADEETVGYRTSWVAWQAALIFQPAPVARTGSTPEAFYDGTSKEPCLMWAYDGYKPRPNDVVLYAHSPLAIPADQGARTGVRSLCRSIY